MDGLVAEHLFGYKRSNYGDLTVFESPEYQSGKSLHAFGNLCTLEDVPGRPNPVTLKNGSASRAGPH